jgi:bacterioferritin-associated ferredoxin
MQNGSRNCADVANACGAGSGCGGCASLVAEIVQGEAKRCRLLVLKSDSASPRAALAAMGEPAPAY